MDEDKLVKEPPVQEPEEWPEPEPDFIVAHTIDVNDRTENPILDMFG